MKVTTEKQFGALRMLASGGVLALPGRRKWTPLLSRGWVERQDLRSKLHVAEDRERRLKRKIESIRAQVESVS